MMNVLPLLGGKKETALGVSGIGDLVATGSSRHSSNYMAGMDIGEGKERERHCEGRPSIAACAALVEKQKRNLPLLFTIKDILDDRINPLSAFKKF